jgi:hypothetical protein
MGPVRGMIALLPDQSNPSEPFPREKVPDFSQQPKRQLHS